MEQTHKMLSVALVQKMSPWNKTRSLVHKMSSVGPVQKMSLVQTISVNRVRGWLLSSLLQLLFPWSLIRGVVTLSRPPAPQSRTHGRGPTSAAARRPGDGAYE